MGLFHRTASVAIIVISTTITLYLQRKIDNHKCAIESPLDDINTPSLHVPLAVQYPIPKREIKVDLSIGIICLPEINHIQSTKEALLSTTNQIQSDQTKLTFQVYICIHSQNESGWELVKNNFKDLTQKLRIQFITLSSRRLEKRMNNQDLDVLNHIFHSSFMKRLAQVNMLLGLMFWRSSQESRYILHIESEDRANEDFRKGLKDSFEWFSSLKDNDGYKAGTLYSSKYLEDYSNHLYYMGVYGNYATMQSMFQFYNANSLPTGDAFIKFTTAKIDTTTRSHVNPPAVHSTNMQSHDIHYSTNPYEHGTKFWSKSAVNGSYITVKFLEKINIKRIVITSGEGVYLSDAVTRAILSESYGYNKEDCGEFHRISDFRAGMIDLVLDRPITETTCLQIYFVAKELHWVAIQSFDVYT